MHLFTSSSPSMKSTDAQLRQHQDFHLCDLYAAPGPIIGASMKLVCIPQGSASILINDKVHERDGFALSPFAANNALLEAAIVSRPL